MTSPFADRWGLDPEIIFLNHGSFGACPKEVLAVQQELRAHIESEPVAFYMREFEPRLVAAREALCSFLNADTTDLVFVPNATTAVSAVLRSLEFEPGDELLTTDHVYNACKNALEFVAARSGATVVVAPTPFPLSGPREFAEAVLDRATDRTKLALLDHVTSPTGLIAPVEAMVRALQARGIDCLVDGAHAPGMLPLDLRELDAAYYTGNCHKWMCSPKGAAFLFVREDRQDRVRPLTISHGANSPRTDKSRFQLEFDWPGTADPTAWLSIPAALAFLEGLMPGGIEALRTHNHELVLQGRRILCDALDLEPPAPDAMLGSLASIPIPDAADKDTLVPMQIDPLQDVLYRESRIEVPVMPWPAPPHRVLRISAQAYNEAAQYERLAARLRRLLSL